MIHHSSKHTVPDTLIRLRLFFLLALFYSTKITEACLCPNYGLEYSYNHPGTQLTRVRILGSIKKKNKNLYVAIVKEKYNKGGSSKKNDYILINGATHSCGTSYNRDGLWIVSIGKTTSGGEGLYSTSPCGFNKKWEFMRDTELEYLKSTYNKLPEEV